VKVRKTKKESTRGGGGKSKTKGDNEGWRRKNEVIERKTKKESVNGGGGGGTEARERKP
jgi:hypothetical protein